MKDLVFWWNFMFHDLLESNRIPSKESTLCSMLRIVGLPGVGEEFLLFQLAPRKLASGDPRALQDIT